MTGMTIGNARRDSLSAGEKPKERTATAVIPPRGRGLFLGLLPLLILGAVCVGGVLQRNVVAYVSGRPFGHMTKADAQRVASTLCQKMLGGPPPALTETMTQSAYSRRRKVYVREWSVVCGTPEGQYLFRINADSGRVYAINQLSSDEAEAADSHDGPPLSRSQAEAMARHYLQIAGVPSNEMEVSLDTPRERNLYHGAQWNFTFRRNVPGIGERLMKVSVSSKDGELEHVWNPVWAL